MVIQMSCQSVEKYKNSQIGNLLKGYLIRGELLKWFSVLEEGWLVPRPVAQRHGVHAQNACRQLLPTKSQKSTHKGNRVATPWLCGIRFGLRDVVCGGWYSPQKKSF